MLSDQERKHVIEKVFEAMQSVPDILWQIGPVNDAMQILADLHVELLENERQQSGLVVELMETCAGRDQPWQS